MGDAEEDEEEEEVEVEVSSSGGSGLTLWGDNSVSLYINTANVRPNAGRYRNTFWREHTGGMEGEVLFSWYLGRGQRLSDKAALTIRLRERALGRVSFAPCCPSIC